MGKYLERSKEVRACTDPHYNCAQGVFVPFAEVCGVDEKKAFDIAAHFGAGMKCGSVCGAITGGLMVLGAIGAGQDQYKAFMDGMRANHEGCIDCFDLLKMMKEKGEDKATHCNNMVFEAVALLEDILNMK
ncbi:MAG: C-GCAxxG-C-C family protein [Lachnospiraceae bacterium]|nr:C-GCAxxG-C-C family protein [Lachnospiraceae bacterium]